MIGMPERSFRKQDKLPVNGKITFFVMCQKHKIFFASFMLITDKTEER